jgi:hypothetical protein
VCVCVYLTAGVMSVRPLTLRSLTPSTKKGLLLRICPAREQNKFLLTNLQRIFIMVLRA